MKKSRLFNLALLLVCVLCVQTSRAQDDNPFNLPEGTRARLGKGAINGWWSPVAYSSDGMRLAVASGLGIWLYDAHTGTELALLTDHITRISSVAFAPDGKLSPAPVTTRRCGCGMSKAETYRIRYKGIWV